MTRGEREEKLAKKWGYINYSAEKDLKELNIDEEKLSKVPEKLTAKFEVIYWELLLKLVEEWT